MSEIEGTKPKKGKNMKGVENKRAKALENLKAGREKRAALLKAKRDAELGGNEVDLDDDTESDEEVDVSDFVLSKKKPKAKVVKNDLHEEVARIKEAIIELSKKQAKPKRRSTKLVMVPAAAPVHEKPKVADSRYDELRRSILGR